MGLDLASAFDYSISPGETVQVSTDLELQFPPGIYGRVFGRAAACRVKHLVVESGLIDHDYLGTIYLVVTNLGGAHVAVRRGERLAQLVCEHYAHLDVVAGMVRER